MGRAKKRALVLFADEWDRRALSRPELAQSYVFEHAGFDLFRFPENIRVLTLDSERFLDRFETRWRRLGLDLVVSHHELWGALFAAELARRLALPGHSPEAVLLAQHKLACRERLAKELPEATPRFAALPPTGELVPPALGFPLLVKPIKATFSILARRVENADELAALRRFGGWERLLFHRLLKPFEQLRSRLLPSAASSEGFLAEELAPGGLFNVDGFVAGGQVRLLGVVEARLYPGTLAFERFELPSRLPPPVVERAIELSRRAVTALGLNHGFFNVELLYDPASDRLTLIEVNPRLAYQLADLYRRTHGWDLHLAALQLAAGEEPRLGESATGVGAAASFVYRRFDGRPQTHWPGRAELAELFRLEPEAFLLLYPRRGAALRREMSWVGSYRYAVLNLGGRDQDDLLARERRLAQLLGLKPSAEVSRHTSGQFPTPTPTPT